MNEQEALHWIAGIFEEPEGNINAETLREDIAAWDSLGMLTLMAALDEEFGIVLSEDDIENFKAVGDILDLFRQHGQLT